MGAVVVLNGSGQYWGDRSLRDIIRLHVNDKITTLLADESEVIRSASSHVGSDFYMQLPLVVILKTFFGCTLDEIQLTYSDELVYERDQNFCQYWHYDEFGRKFRYRCSASDRTIDHILPRWRGGRDSFINCVCACKVCNIKRKGGKTPKEAGLKLIRPPVDPQRRVGGWARVPFNFNPESLAHVAYKRYLDSLAA
jgi:hypothetical protein